MPDTVVLTSPEQACDLVRSHSHLSICGGGTKPGLWASTQDAVRIDTRGLSGILEYEPDEYVFTARAGTPLKEIVDVLAKAGQYLPFDPLFVEGGTLGGCIASGVAGPGRFRYGGVRDFIIGLRFVDGTGTLIKGGGKVVKNAAGFDYPKLFVGSLGRLGLITEASFKVFPKPQAGLVASVEAESANEAAKIISTVAMKPYDLDAVEYTEGKVYVRITGNEAALKARLEAMRKETGLALDTTTALPAVTGNVRVPMSLPQLPSLDAALASLGVARRHYSVGGNVAWFTWPDNAGTESLDATLKQLKLAALHLNGSKARLGLNASEGAERVVKSAMDAGQKFGSLD